MQGKLNNLQWEGMNLQYEGMKDTIIKTLSTWDKQMVSHVIISTNTMINDI